jgi:Lrp/AsnC family transcriptional regulator, leucine-responsive regulatory protein
MDATDRRILQELQRDASLSNVELADRVGLTPAPCLRRVKRLKETGVISRYVALIDPTAIGLDLDVFVSVTLDRQRTEVAEAFEQAVADRPEVQECYLIAGAIDYLIRVKMADLSSFQRWLWEVITVIDGVANVQSSIAMRRAKYTTELPISS